MLNITDFKIKKFPSGQKGWGEKSTVFKTISPDQRFALITTERGKKTDSERAVGLFDLESKKIIEFVTLNHAQYKVFFTQNSKFIVFIDLHCGSNKKKFTILEIVEKFAITDVDGVKK